MTSLSSNTSFQEDSLQPVKKKPKTSRKKTSWIWEYFIEKLNDNNELIIVYQVKKENEITYNVMLKYDRSTGNKIGHLWSIHKITKDEKQSKMQYLNQ